MIVSLSSICLLGLWLFWWVNQNPLPDGYQNEYLHVGNAFDLYEALVDFDWWHVRWYAYTSYWPWGFYAIPLSILLPFGKGVVTLILSNLLYLIPLFYAMRRLAVHYKSALSPYILLLTPAVFGAMTRFEPNFANISFMTIGLLALIESDGFKHRRWAILWGVSLGVGLMVDRLTLIFFLGPAVIPILRIADWNQRSVRRNIALGFGSILLCTLAYYREFLIRHSQELLSQAPVGEIDSTGLIIETSNVAPYLYYVLSLFDSQAGFVIASVMIIGVAKAAVQSDSKDSILWWSMVPGVLFFTFVAKKQVYYTFPILVPLAILAGRVKGLSLVACLFGGLLWLQQGWGLIPSSVPLNYSLPESWVTPKYLLARPPSHQSYSMKEIIDAIDGDPKEIIVFSQDQSWYEGFAVLQLRENLEGHIRGVTADPIGVFEFSEKASYLIWIYPTDTTEQFPTVGHITTELLSDHYDISELPDVSNTVNGLQTSFDLVTTWCSKEDSCITLFKRTKP